MQIARGAEMPKYDWIKSLLSDMAVFAEENELRNLSRSLSAATLSYELDTEDVSAERSGMDLLEAVDPRNFTQ